MAVKMEVKLGLNSFQGDLLNGIKVRVFFEKIMEKKELCHHDKNDYYFRKSSIPVTNLVVGRKV